MQVPAMNNQFVLDYIQACSILRPISWGGNLTNARAKPSHARLRQDQDQWGHSGESRGQPGKLPPSWKAQPKPARESQPELAGAIAPRQEKPRSQPGSLPFYFQTLLALCMPKVSNTFMNQTQSYLEQWHQGLKSMNSKFLDEILDDSCVFTSPIVFKPIKGKEMSKLYLMGAGQTFDMDRFKYVRELVDGLDTVLEFETYIDDISVNGVDIIRLNEEGKIIDFKVMIRPLQAIGALQKKMSEALESLNK